MIVAFGYDLSPVGGELHDYYAALKNLATKRIEEATEVAAAEGAEVEGTILEHGAAHGLAQLATERNARMIVIGTRGEGPLRGAILGSTAHKLLHLSDRPVLVDRSDPNLRRSIAHQCPRKHHDRVLPRGRVRADQQLRRDRRRPAGSAIASCS